MDFQKSQSRRLEAYNKDKVFLNLIFGLIFKKIYCVAEIEHVTLQSKKWHLCCLAFSSDIATHLLTTDGN